MIDFLKTYQIVLNSKQLAVVGIIHQRRHKNYDGMGNQNQN